MSAELVTPEKVKVSGAITVLLTLLGLTLLAAFASYLHLPHKLALATAVGLTLVKASVVGAAFLQLKAERRVVGALLSLTALVFFLLLFLPHWTSPGGLVARY